MYLRKTIKNKGNPAENLRLKVSVKDIIIKNCAQVRSYVGMDEQALKMVHESSGAVLARKNEILQGALGSLLQDAEAVSIAQRAGLDPERAKALLEYWLSLTLQGGYDERHCLEVARIGLAHVKAGVPAKLMVAQMTAFAREILRHFPGDLTHACAIIQALGWNLAVMIHSYEIIRQRVFGEATGISEEVYGRLVHVYARELYEEISKELK
jgi:hypothetical protein